MFLIPQGTRIQAVRSGLDWSPRNMRSHVTRKDNVFDKEEVIVDPVGKLGANRQHACTIGGSYARNGWYGFESDGWIMLVPANQVTYA